MCHSSKMPFGRVWLTFIGVCHSFALKPSPCSWVTEALWLANDLGLDISMDFFSTSCKQAIKHNFTSVWLENLQNTQLNPLLRAYRTFKHEFAMEPYLHHVKKPKWRIAIANFVVTHILEIERGRHTNPKNLVAVRKRLRCNVVEDEKHFLLNCYINASEREYYFHRVSKIDDRFLSLNDEGKFSYKLTKCNPQCLT